MSSQLGAALISCVRTVLGHLRRFSRYTDLFVIWRNPDQCQTSSEIGDVPNSHKSTCGMAITSVYCCYGDLHAAIASGRVRLATEGGVKIAR